MNARARNRKVRLRPAGARSDGPLLVALLAVLLAWMPGSLEPGQVGREIAVLAGCLLLAATGLARRSPRARVSRLAVPVLLVLVPWAIALAGATMAPAPERIDVAWAAVRLGAPWLLAVLVWRRGATDEARDRVARSITLACAWGCGILGALGIAQYWAGLDLLEQARAPAATFVNRNVAAQALVAAIPLALPAGLLARTGAARLAALAAAAAGMVLLVATHARAAWAAAGLGLAVGLILFGLRHAASRRRYVAAAIVVCGVAAGLAAVVPAPRATRLPGVVRSVALLVRGEEGSAGVRAALRANAASMLAARPLLGYGAGRFPVAYAEWNDARVPTPGWGLERRPRHVHSEPLELAIELGVPAALLLASFLVGGAWSAARSALAERRHDAAACKAGQAAAVVGVIVHGLFSFPLHSPASAVLAFAAAAAGWHGLAREGGSRALEASLGLLAAAALLVGPVDVRAERDAGRAVRLQALGRCSEALGPARRAVDGALRRETAGLSAMVVFECDRSAPGSLPWLERALRRYPGNLNLLLAVGSRRIKAGDLDGAEQAFEQAARIAPDLGRARFGLAMVADRRGQPDRAAALCSEALEDRELPDQARRYCEAVIRRPRTGTSGD